MRRYVSIHSSDGFHLNSELLYEQAIFHNLVALQAPEVKRKISWPASLDNTNYSEYVISIRQADDRWCRILKLYSYGLKFKVAYLLWGKCFLWREGNELYVSPECCKPYHRVTEGAEKIFNRS